MSQPGARSYAHFAPAPRSGVSHLPQHSPLVLQGKLPILLLLSYYYYYITFITIIILLLLYYFYYRTYRFYITIIIIIILLLLLYYYSRIILLLYYYYYITISSLWCFYSGIFCCIKHQKTKTWCDEDFATVIALQIVKIRNFCRCFAPTILYLAAYITSICFFFVTSLFWCILLY